MTNSKDLDASARLTVRGAATRRRLLKSAEDALGRNGYIGASVAKITSRAGVAVGTFYLYFRSKEDVLCTLLESLAQSTRDLLLASSAGARNRNQAEHLRVQA